MRNAGLDWMEKNSQNQFLAFVDADDCLHPQYLELLMALQQASGLYIAMCGYDFFETDGAFFTDRFDVSAEVDAVQLLDTKEMLDNFCDHFRKVSLRSQCMKLFKRDMYKGVRMQEGSTQEDTLMLPWMLDRADGIAVADRKLYHWRETPGSVSRSAFDARNFHYIDIAYSYTRFFLDRGHKQAVYFKREFLYNSLKYYYRAYSQRPELMEALKPYLRLYKKHCLWIFTSGLCLRERLACGLFWLVPRLLENTICRCMENVIERSIGNVGETEISHCAFSLLSYCLKATILLCGKDHFPSKIPGMVCSLFVG